MTYAEWFSTATNQLKEHGFSHADAHAAARLLLDWITQTRHAHLLRPETALDSHQLEKLHAVFEETLNHRPLAYITGAREFYGRSFKCDERALIPRPETELLLDLAVERLQGAEHPKVADMGTGTGCIAITLALELPGAQVFATDLSPGARELAAENADRLGASVRFLEGQEAEWAAPLMEFAPFDALFSNPPYIAAMEIPELQPEIFRFEPHLALDGGEDGLNPYRLMAVQCRELLRPNGFLAAELGAGQWSEVAAIFTRAGWHVEPAIQDLAGHERVIVAAPSG